LLVFTLAASRLNSEVYFFFSEAVTDKIKFTIHTKNGLVLAWRIGWLSEKLSKTCILQLYKKWEGICDKYGILEVGRLGQ